MTCVDADLMLAAEAVGALDQVDATGLRLHLLACSHCRVEGDLYRYAADMIAESVPLVAPSSKLRSRLMARVVAEAGAGPATATPEPRPPWHLRLWTRVPAGRALTLAGGLSAAAAAVLAAWSLAVPHGAASVAMRVATCGAAGGPEASCVLVYDRAARQSVLTVRGLPSAPVVGGTILQTYEVWLISASGAATPAALLTERPGSTEWSAAISGDLAGYTAVATTAEPAGGRLTPRGPEVLRVSLPGGLG